MGAHYTIVIVRNPYVGPYIRGLGAGIRRVEALVWGFRPMEANLANVGPVYWILMVI